MTWENVSPVALIVAAIGAGGIGVFFRDVVDVFLKLRDGLSAREKNRKSDILQQRDAALRREELAWQQRDVESAKRRRMEEHASELRRLAIEAGITPPPYPVLERTLSVDEVRSIIKASEEKES